MARAGREAVAVAILAKAPLPGFAKTRLAPILGADGAAALQARLIERAVDTARAADIGPVTLWAAPDQDHPTFQTLAALFGVALARQPDGDLGARMLAAIAAACGPALVIDRPVKVATPPTALTVFVPPSVPSPQLLWPWPLGNAPPSAGKAHLKLIRWTQPSCLCQPAEIRNMSVSATIARSMAPRTA